MIPAEFTYPCLVENDDGHPGHCHGLQGRMLSIGANESNNLHLSGLQPRHAFLLYQMGRYILKPLVESESVKINGRGVDKEQEVRHGDELQLGSHTFLYLEKPLLDGKKDEHTDIHSPATSASISSQMFDAILLLLREHDLDRVIQNLVKVVAQMFRCDGVNLIQDEYGLWRSLAVFPSNAASNRFSSSAIRKADSTNGTVLLSRKGIDNLPKKESVQLNNIASVLCAPLSDSDSECPGFLYMDRIDGNPPFSENDRSIFESLRGVFGELIKQAKRSNRQMEVIKSLRKQAEVNTSGAVYQDEKMQSIYGEASRLAQTTVPVLVLGETGTGKELMAHFIHDNSDRARKPFIAVNCGAISKSLIESELFGHEKGAFTGADKQKIGAFEAADGGTLFLDEVGELPLEMQVKLLRVLQEGVVQHIGSVETIKVDFRLVSATNRNLDVEVTQGNFRQDLFFRLNVVPLTLPPLRSRKGDVILLANHFLKRFCSQYGLPARIIGKRAEQVMLSHPWPGNIRELENRIHKAVILGGTETLKPEDLDLLLDSTLPGAAAIQSGESLKSAREAAEEKCITAALELHKGNVSQVARSLEVDRKVLTRLIQRLEIDPSNFKK